MQNWELTEYRNYISFIQIKIYIIEGQNIEYIQNKKEKTDRFNFYHLQRAAC